MKKSIKLSEHINTIETTFGDSLDFKKVIPLDTKAIILFKNDGTGFKPIRLLLPHQVYFQGLEKMVDEDIHSFSILPIDMKKLVKIAEVQWRENQ